MDTLRDGYSALVIGASGGIGGAILAQLKGDPRCGSAIGLSRSGDGLDVTDEASILAAATRLKETPGEFDLVFDATGGLEIDGIGPEKTIRAIDPAVMARQFALNAIGPALLLKHLSPLMPRDRRAIFATLSARVGSIGDNRLGGWISYRAAKSALNQIVRTSAVEIARTRPEAVLATLHPGTVDTKLSAGMKVHHEVFAPAKAASLLLSVIDGLTPGQSGGFFGYDGQAIEW